MITRRRFVQTVGIGAAGAIAGSWIAARGREDSIWSAALEAQTPAAAANTPIDRPVEQREPARAGQKVLDAMKAAFGPAGAAPGRYSGASGALVEALAKKHGVPPGNITLGCGSTQILRTATHVFTARNHGARRHDSDLRGVRRLRRHDGPSRPRGAARSELQHGSRSPGRRRARRRARLLLQPEQPDGHLHRRARVTGLLRPRRPHLAGDEDPGGRGLLRLRHGHGSRDAHPARHRRSAHHRRADVLEGVRPGGPAHRLRRRAHRDDCAR